MSGFGNLQVLGATSEDTSEYYEKGLLAPVWESTTNTPPPYLGANCDVIDGDGYVTLPSGPGMGYDVQWDFIEDNLIEPTVARKRGW